TTELTLQIDETTRTAFDKLCEGSGLSESAMFMIIVKKVADTGLEKATSVTTEKSTEKPAKRGKTMRERIEALETKEYDPEAFGRALESMRRKSEENGNCNMTMDEINAEIALSRKERREQCAVLAELRAATPWIDKSGFISRKGNHAIITDMVRDRDERIQLCCKAAILAEYTEVLKRKHFRFDEKEVDDFLNKVKKYSLFHEPPKSTFPMIDEKDRCF
ncbi:MAG: hypothetical protein FWG64_00580, partial [Firmicutes bacterium]|nr:hypothetical protein [Bacillota bacterium]